MTDITSVQLATLYSRWPDDTARLSVEPKIDGYRLTAKVEADGVRFFCRDTQDGAEVDWTPNLAHIARDLLSLGPLVHGCTFDGEVSGETWNSTSSLLRTHRDNLTAAELDTLERTVKFHAFDVLNDSWGVIGMKHGKRGRKLYETVDVPYDARRKHLCRLVLDAHIPHPLESLVVVPAFEALNETQVMDLYADFIEHGYEGAIVKDPHAPYVAGRLPYWAKIKPNETIDLTIDHAVEGAGKHSGRLGALSCVYPLTGAIVSVGTGFDDALRTALWLRRDQLAGLHVEVKVQSGNVALARHPVFVRFRDDLNKVTSRSLKDLTAP